VNHKCTLQAFVQVIPEQLAECGFVLYQITSRRRKSKMKPDKKQHRPSGLKQRLKVQGQQFAVRVCNNMPPAKQCVGESFSTKEIENAELIANQNASNKFKN
jgi:hypothetical protein